MCMYSSSTELALYRPGSHGPGSIQARFYTGLVLIDLAMYRPGSDRLCSNRPGSHRPGSIQAWF